MNKGKTSEEIHNVLTSYTDKGFRFHPKFIEEFLEILNKTARGHEPSVFSMFSKQLRFVDVCGFLVNTADGNEILKDFTTDFSCYSLHIQDKMVNIRILMAFGEDEKNALFLGAFFERKGKSFTDYSEWSRIVSSRYKQFRR